MIVIEIDIPTLVLVSICVAGIFFLSGYMTARYGEPGGYVAPPNPLPPPPPINRRNDNGFQNGKL